MRWILTGLLIIVAHGGLLVSMVAPSILTGKPAIKVNWYPLYDWAALTSVLWMLGLSLGGLILIYRENQKSAPDPSGALTNQRSTSQTGAGASRRRQASSRSKST